MKGKTLELKHTTVFTKTWQELSGNRRFIIEQGGSRSSKTTSILQCLIVWGLTNGGRSIDIIRKTLPTLKASSMKDFFSLMRDLDLYDVRAHNKTNHTYTFPNGTEINFFAVDDEQKLRGRKRDLLFCNEANELSSDEFLQLNLRTTGKVILDFNPSDDQHWIYDLILRDDAVLIKSNYLDNPFLSEAQVKEIEHLISVDENYYKIYALGERPVSKTRIYTHFGHCYEVPEGDDFYYGLDFGFNAPTALVKITDFDSTYFVEELLYKQYLTSTDIVSEMEALGINKNKAIYADSARPEIIQELRRAGYNMKVAKKEVKAGIDFLKRSEIKIKSSSLNLLSEIKTYNWKTNGTIILDEPVKLNDHALDAMRYGIFSAGKVRFNSKATQIFKPRLRGDDDDW